MGHPVYSGKQVRRILETIEIACGGDLNQVQRAIDTGALMSVFSANWQDFDRELLKEALGLRPKREPELLVIGEFPTWRSVEIPVLTVKEWIATLEAAGKRVSNQAKDIMTKPAFRTLAALTTLDFIKAKVGDLGFTDPENLPTTTKIVKRADQVGLNKCPPEVGPAARLVSSDHDDFYVVMDTITGSDGYPHVFCCYLGKPGLDVYDVHPDGLWALESELVFVRRVLAEKPVLTAQAA